MPVHPPAELVEAAARRDRRAAERADPPDRRDALVLRRRRARHGRARPALVGRRRRRAPTPRRPRTCSRTRSSRPASIPSASSAAELAKLVAARAEIPRAAFDEALAHSGDDGFSADPYLAQKAVSDVGELDPVIDARDRREPGAGRAVPRRQAGPARLLRRPGDEGDRRQGRPARRQRRGVRREARRASLRPAG